MDIKKIQDLIKFVAKSGVNEVAIEEQDFKITIKTNQGQATTTYVTATPTVPPAPQVVQTSPATAQGQNNTNSESPQESKESSYITIKSPMIGTFYRSSSPDKPPFINVGDDVSTGQVVCIVEAMKLFNEIESEISGRIVKVLVEDAQPVEYDQPLFLVDPK